MADDLKQIAELAVQKADALRRGEERRLVAKLERMERADLEYRRWASEAGYAVA